MQCLLYTQRLCFNLLVNSVVKGLLKSGQGGHKWPAGPRLAMAGESILHQQLGRQLPPTSVRCVKDAPST